MNCCASYRVDSAGGVALTGLHHHHHPHQSSADTRLPAAAAGCSTLLKARHAAATLPCPVMVAHGNEQQVRAGAAAFNTYDVIAPPPVTMTTDDYLSPVSAASYCNYSDWMPDDDRRYETVGILHNQHHDYCYN